MKPEHTPHRISSSVTRRHRTETCYLPIPGPCSFLFGFLALQALISDNNKFIPLPGRGGEPKKASLFRLFQKFPGMVEHQH